MGKLFQPVKMSRLPNMLPHPPPSPLLCTSISHTYRIQIHGCLRHQLQCLLAEVFWPPEVDSDLVCVGSGDAPYKKAKAASYPIASSTQAFPKMQSRSERFLPCQVISRDDSFTSFRRLLGVFCLHFYCKSQLISHTNRRNEVKLSSLVIRSKNGRNITERPCTTPHHRIPSRHALCHFRPDEPTQLWSWMMTEA